MPPSSYLRKKQPYYPNDERVFLAGIGQFDDTTFAFAAAVEEAYRAIQKMVRFTFRLKVFYD